MEDPSTKISIGQGIPWPKRPFETTPSGSAMRDPSNLPLGSGSFQLWKKPYLMINHCDSTGASSRSGTKTCFRPSDANSHPATAADDSNKNTKNPSDKNVSSSDSVTSGDGGDGDGDGDDDNSFKTETANGVQFRWGRNLDPNMDPKKLKRIISNRLSAQKSRMKKLQYVSDMERRVKALEAQIAVLSPQVSFYKNQQHLLQIEQRSLKQQVSSFANNKIFRDAEIEENKVELNRLRRLHLKQQHHQMQAQTINWDTGMEQMANPNLNQPGMEHMVYVNSNQAQNGENTTEVNMLNQLNMTQEQQKQGEAWLPSWELALGQMVNPINQSATQLKLNVNLNLGGIDTMLNFSTLNSDPRNCFI